MRTVWTLDDDEATRLINEEGLGVTELARRMGVSRQSIYVAIKRGRIPAPDRARLGDSSTSRDGSTNGTPGAENA